jgi:hypothetical protein
VCPGVPRNVFGGKFLVVLVEKTPPPPPPPGESKGIRNINFRDKTFGWKIFSLSIRFIREGVMARDNSKISNIKFRHKEHGKRRNKFLVGSAMSDSHDFVESLHRNIFMKGFLGNLYLRPSCYNCPVRSLKSGADITIGDYWGIENILPDFDDDRGVSLVLINTEKGGRIYDRLNKIEMETSYHDALRGNPSLESSVVLRPGRKHFFLNFEKKGVIESIRRLTRTGVHIHMKNIINYILRKVGIITHRS